MTVQIVMDNSGDSRFEFDPTDQASIAEAIDAALRTSHRAWLYGGRTDGVGNVSQSDDVRSVRDRGAIHTAACGRLMNPSGMPSAKSTDDGKWLPT